MPPFPDTSLFRDTLLHNFTPYSLLVHSTNHLPYRHARKIYKESAFTEHYDLCQVFIPGKETSYFLYPDVKSLLGTGRANEGSTVTVFKPFNGQ